MLFDHCMMSRWYKHAKEDAREMITHQSFCLVITWSHAPALYSYTIPYTPYILHVRRHAVIECCLLSLPLVSLSCRLFEDGVLFESGDY